MIKRLSRIVFGMAIGFFVICLLYSGYCIYMTKIEMREKLQIQEEKIQIQEQEINSLQLQIEDYERIKPILPILRQLLTPLTWLELEALAEQREQRGVKNEISSSD